MMEYIVHKIRHPLEGLPGWDENPWGTAPWLEISHFRPESSSHRPRTRVKLVYNQDGLYGCFQVLDRYVRCTRTRFQEAVCKDSCVEFFVQPKPARGYFNFEFNCGGAALMYYITDPVRTAEGFKAFTRLTKTDGESVHVWTTLPQVVEPEIQEEITWYLQFFIPFSLLREYAGEIEALPGTAWRANFYKCGDETSHPHWAAWSPVDALNFHLPRCFGMLRFVE